jgi:hypothetical protein
MKFASPVFLVVLALVGPVVGHTADPGALTVSEYVALSIERLELAKEVLERESRVLSEPEVGSLCLKYGTTTREYLTYAGRYKQEIDEYLANNPELAVRISNLSEAMRSQVSVSE